MRLVPQPVEVRHLVLKVRQGVAGFCHEPVNRKVDARHLTLPRQHFLLEVLKRNTSHVSAEVCEWGTSMKARVKLYNGKHF